jgi:hypothetical protein
MLPALKGDDWSRCPGPVLAYLSHKLFLLALYRTDFILRHFVSRLIPGVPIYILPCRSGHVSQYSAERALHTIGAHLSATCPSVL